MIPNDPETLLRREQLAAALDEAGYPVSPKTLAAWACRGGGPPFRKWGRFPMYPWGEALAWAKARLGPLVRSASEAEAEAPGKAPRLSLGSLGNATGPSGRALGLEAAPAALPPLVFFDSGRESDQ
jgi:hypothetical protein